MCWFIVIGRLSFRTLFFGQNCGINLPQLLNCRFRTVFTFAFHGDIPVPVALFSSSHPAGIHCLSFLQEPMEESLFPVTANYAGRP
jgi:hypothetical protein